MDRSLTAIRDIQERLTEVPSSARDAAPQWLVESMGELVGCDLFGAYRPAKDAAGVWRLGELVSTNFPQLRAADAVMARTKAPFHYDPLRPAPSQRNAVFMLRELHTHPPDQTCTVEDVFPVAGMGGWDQLRALVCEGPVVVSWVGGFRPEPFTERERALFTALVPMLRRALAFHRRLADAGLGAREIAAVLEAIAAPAFIASRSGAIDHANTAARALVDRGVAEARARVRDTIARPCGSSFVGRVGPPGESERFLVILRDEDALLQARLDGAARRWSVTPREREVLRLMVGGDSNKEIATKLGCHEGSVERHVTSLLRKARCDSRGRIIARFWTHL